MELAVMLVAVGALFTWSVVSGYRRRARHDIVLPRIAEHLGGGVTSDGASGARHGIPVTFQFATRGSGSSRENWTQIDAVLPVAYPLAIHARPRQKVFGVEITLSSPALYDADLAIEAAPEDVAQVLLDGNVRTLLKTYRRFELDTITDHGRKVLRLAIPEWIEDVAAMTSAIDTIAWMASQVREAYAAIEQAIPMQVGGAPYRPQLDDQGAREASSARHAEVTALETSRTARQRWWTAILIVVVVVVVAAEFLVR